MSNIFKYKGYEGTIEPDMERGVLRGRILFISDVVTYESDNMKSIESEFRDAVDDYLETCTELGRQPQKPMSGQFNVRTPPELHKDAKRRAVQDGSTLNDVVVRALACYLHGKPEVTNNHYLVVRSEELGNKVFVTALSNDSQFGVEARVRTH